MQPDKEKENNPISTDQTPFLGFLYTEWDYKPEAESSQPSPSKSNVAIVKGKFNTL